MRLTICGEQTFKHGGQIVGKAASGAAEPEPKGWMTHQNKEARVRADWPEGESGVGSKYSSHIYLWALLKSRATWGTSAPMNEVFLERYRVGNSQTIALYKHGAAF